MITLEFLITSLIVVLIPGPGVVLTVSSGIFMAMTIAVFVGYGFLAHAFRREVIEPPRVQSWLRRSFAAAFAGLGVNLALSDK